MIDFQQQLKEGLWAHHKMSSLEPLSDSLDLVNSSSSPVSLTPHIGQMSVSYPHREGKPEPGQF